MIITSIRTSCSIGRFGLLADLLCGPNEWLLWVILKIDLGVLYSPISHSIVRLGSNTEVSKYRFISHHGVTISIEGGNKRASLIRLGADDERIFTQC